MEEQRDLEIIAREIRDDWAGKVYFGARPYLAAMRTMGGMSDMFGYDSARSIVSYFLVNATRWRGPVARRVKAELRGMLK